MKAFSSLTIDKFSPIAKRLREHFDSRFGDPLKASDKRFIWDHWHVPGQYTLLRTPAEVFFPKKLHDELRSELLEWGRANLGCVDVSPIWLSCYIEGCEQKFHADLPHGPFAFVYSLTNWEKRKFTGGETTLFSEVACDVWGSLSSLRGQGLEEDTIFTRIEPVLGRLAVFDPRIPHGVARVSGTSDVREGRLVLHGWFTRPEPMISGPLSPEELSSALTEFFDVNPELFTPLSASNGLVSVRFRVGRDGKTSQVALLASTLRASDGGLPLDKGVLALKKALSKLRFGKQKSLSEVTLPLVFEA